MGKIRINIEKQLIECIKKYSSENVEFDENTDLLEEKILSSYGFMNVLVELEQMAEKELDFEKIDITQMCSVKGMLDIISDCNS